MKHTYLILFVLLTGVTLSCKKNNQDATFKGKNQLIIGGDYSQTSAQDSIVFSFAEFDLTTTEGEIMMNVLISGEVAKTDREFKVEVVDSLSAVNKDEYSIPTGLKIPAGQTKSVFYVKIKRTPRLVNEYAKIVLRVVPNENFEPGPKTPVNYIIASNLNPWVINYGPTFKLLWTDVLTKPPSWDVGGVGMNGYVGIWSKVKHKLIIDATGIRNFSALSNAQKYQLQSVAAIYLNNYNNAHPGDPLKNENGVVIKICPGASCP